MDEGGSSSNPNGRKVRYPPKGAPPRRKLAVGPSVEEPCNEGDEKAAQALLRRVNEHHGRRPKVEKKSSVHVAFGQRSETSTPFRTWGKPNEGSVSRTDELPLQDSSQGNKQITISSLSTAATDQTGGGPTVHVNTSRQQLEKKYIEPWDYNSLYPVTLPLRRPYSGDPELLNDAEFGPGAAATEYDEDLTNSAAELELLDEKEDAQMLFFQLPPKLPIVKNRPGADAATDISKTSKIENALHTARRDETARSSKPMETIASTKARGKEKVDNVDLGVSPTARGMEIAGKTLFSRKRTENLEDLRAGYMGKMLVYKSGAIKLKLGDILYDVSPGSSCIFAEDVVAINTVDKEFCRLGEIKKRAIVTPDQSLFDNVNDFS